jgi:hypothetical protein
MTEDLLVRAASDRLLPPEPPDFLDVFWERTAAREHLAVRRWRRATLAAAAVALAALGAAGVIAAPFGSSKVVDRTATCVTQARAGVRLVAIAASPTRPANAAQYGRYTAAELVFTTGGDWYYGTKLLNLDATLKGYLANEERCANANRDIPLEPRGLSLRADYRKGSYSGRLVTCKTQARIAYRARFTMDEKGRPVSGRVAVQAARGGEPLIYVDWSQRRMRMWAGRACDDEAF